MLSKIRQLKIGNVMVILLLLYVAVSVIAWVCGLIYLVFWKPPEYKEGIFGLLMVVFILVGIIGGGAKWEP